MNYSLYVHIPFCKHRCHYCDFNTFTGKETLIPTYVDALIEEFRIVTSGKTEIPVHSIYFGGGTPSLVTLPLYEKLFESLRICFALTDDCEISLEANPGTLTLDYLAGLQALGFNRISIGVQSTDSFDLARLDRIHDIEDVLQSIQNARVVGFENINLDMIFGLPWQDLPSWEKSLGRAIFLSPDHFSLYSLIVESGTPFFTWYQKGLIAAQDQDLEGEMYERGMALLEAAGYEQYEISNWAKKDTEMDYRCRHNLQYWLNLPYLGFGAGSHGFAESFRTVNIALIEAYIDRINQGPTSGGSFPLSPATISITKIDKRTQMNDFMLLGLRLVKTGVSSERFESQYGHSIMEVFDKEISSLLEFGLVEWVGGEKSRLRLTKRGVMVANQVFMEFV